MKIISDKPLRVATLSGAVVLFEAGVVQEISDEIGNIAIQMGAKEHNKKYVEESAAEEAEFEDVVEDVAVPTKVQPNEVLTTALERMMDEGDPKNFKADGYPKAAAVNKIMGETISSDVREAAWESILNS